MVEYGRAMLTPGIDRPSDSDDGPGAPPGRVALSVARGMRVLRAFRRGDSGLGNAELAERTGMPRPTVSRIAYTLARRGYLIFEPRACEYRLGPRTAALDAAALAASDVRAIALPRLQQMAMISRANVGIAARDGLRMVYLDAAEGDGPVALRLFAGSRIPILNTALGRAYLWALPPVEQERLLAKLRQDREDAWPETLENLKRAFEQIEALGFCLAAGEWLSDINGVAAPVRAPDGRTFSISLGGASFILPPEALIGRFGPQLVTMAREVEVSLAR